MKPRTDRLRMLAGPNGSGKTTLKRIVVEELPPRALGVDLNPDEIEGRLRGNGRVNLRDFGIVKDADDPVAFFREHTLIREKGLVDSVRELSCSDGVLDFTGVEVNSYVASATAAYLREQLLDQRISFTIETVMSSPDKVALLERAQQAGFRTYLYYIATMDPDLNVERVEQRKEVTMSHMTKSSAATGDPWTSSRCQSASRTARTSSTTQITSPNRSRR